MKRLRNRYVLTTYVVLLTLALALGCSTKSDPAETLTTCGNHSCGDLVMVTIDTSSNGYQYLEPTLSPDGSTIAFTADWLTIPSDPEFTGEPILARQILVMPMPANVWDDTMKARWPVQEIEDQGAQLITCGLFESRIGGTPINLSALDITKSGPVWVSSDTMIFLGNFSRRDRLMIADVSNPNTVDPVVLYYEEDDLAPPGTGAQVVYHGDPALSPDGRWLAITRFSCSDFSNAPGVVCSGEMIYIIDMTTTEANNGTTATAFALTTEAAGMEDPTWSPDGRSICFAATTDYVGENDGTVWELFTVAFDPEEAVTGTATLDADLLRLTTTAVAEGDPITGLTNIAPAYDVDGREIYFTSSRRAPGSTLRERSIWRVPADGRLEPEMIFFSREDDVDVSISAETMPSIPLMFSSRMGFPTEQIEAIVDSTMRFYTYSYNDTAEIPLTEIEIARLGEQTREELEFFEDVMSHIYVFRGF